MGKELKIVFILVSLGVLMIISAFIYLTYEMLEDHYCNNLTPYEFFREPRCEKYEDKYNK